MAHFYLWSIICTPLGLSEHLLFLRAVFLSSPPSCLPPVGQRLPHDICTLFKSPPKYLCVLHLPSVSLATSAPLYFCHDASCKRPCVPRPSFSSAAGFLSFLIRDNSSSGFHCVPELSYLPPLPCRMPLLGPRSPGDICTLFRSLPEYLIVSAILCLSLSPLGPSHSHHNAS